MAETKHTQENIVSRRERLRKLNSDLNLVINVSEVDEDIKNHYLDLLDQTFVEVDEFYEPEEEKDKHVMIVQLGDDFECVKHRKTVEAELKKEFVWRQSRGTRSMYAEGDYRRFENRCRELCKPLLREICFYRTIKCLNPGDVVNLWFEEDDGDKHARHKELMDEQSEWVQVDNEPEFVLIFQVDYKQTNEKYSRWGDFIDARNDLTRKLEEAGFKCLDSSMSRACFEDGDFSKFCQVIRRLTSIRVKRVMRCRDPGLGLMLWFPEDGFDEKTNKIKKETLLVEGSQVIEAEELYVSSTPKIECECGFRITENSRDDHLSTARHIKMMDALKQHLDKDFLKKYTPLQLVVLARKFKVKTTSQYKSELIREILESKGYEEHARTLPAENYY